MIRSDFRIRRARPSDWCRIDALVNEAAYRSPDLWRWAHAMDQPGFVVAEVAGVGLAGALLTDVETPPVAWVRMAAVRKHVRVGAWIGRSLDAVVDPLTAAGAKTLAWMDCGAWARPALRTRGFHAAARVITLSKRDRATPPATSPRATLRSATEDDCGAMAEIDREAFDPLWWRSEESVRHRAARASRFVAAELHGKVVGYAEREQHFQEGHINRLAVSPGQQGRGIGGALLTRTLEHLWAGGAEVVSLNTQATNRASRRIYRRFGFAPTGESATVWTLALSRGPKAGPNPRQRQPVCPCSPKGSQG